MKKISRQINKKNSRVSGAAINKIEKNVGAYIKKLQNSVKIKLDISLEKFVKARR